jgi:hypothetical protein
MVAQSCGLILMMRATVCALYCSKYLPRLKLDGMRASPGSSCVGSMNRSKRRRNLCCACVSTYVYICTYTYIHT